ncbi:MAG TPA: Gfo/Idh/MocA family oxidoreductase [Verrucomicrobiae bacterium]|nr:Gfo/Idh/MocA family oxidoreductase [Verrucomicrobiae bacterium]
MSQPPTNEAGFKRRDFLKGGSLATLMTMMGGVQLLAQPTTAVDPGMTLDLPRVKVGLIGLGPWGREILDQLGRLEQADVAAICDNYPTMLRRGSSKAPSAAAIEDYKAVLDNKDIQAVIVATPSHQHKEIAIGALKAGKHVYCEAPLAATVEDAKEIALAAKNSVGQVFQSGLQMRSSPQRLFLLPFIRAGALGSPVMARSQWHKKQSWRTASPNPEREKAANWRLNRRTSPGLVGEIGIHALDQAAWYFNTEPVAVSGSGSTMLWKDGRDVPDTIQLVVEYPGGLRLNYDASLASSFDGEYELLSGSEATVMMRCDNVGKEAAWMFKEVDSAVLGWEVYARKDSFYKETGIVLAAGSSKQTALADQPEAETAVATAPPPLYHALKAFLANCSEVGTAVDNFKSMFDANDKAALAASLRSVSFSPFAGYQEGFAATVLGLKANEAVNNNRRIELKQEWFELA